MAETEELTEQQIIGMFKQMRADQQSILAKISEIEAEINEHNLVIGATEKLEPTRKCFRLVGGILVERTVGETLPALQKNREGLVNVMQSLGTQLQKKTKEMNDHVVKYKIQIKSGPDQSSSSPSESGGQGGKKSNSGVLA